MEPNAFIGTKKAPTGKELAAALGDSHGLWKKVIAELHVVAPTPEWHSYSLKAGWSLKLKKADRVIVYLVPCKDRFQVAFVLGDKAIKAAKESGLPERIIEQLARAKKYAEGTALRFDPATAGDIAAIRKIAVAKANN